MSLFEYFIQEFIKKCHEAGHVELGDELENERVVYVAACRYYQSRQAQEVRKFTEAGALILKSKNLLADAKPTKEISITLKNDLTQLVRSQSATIQAAILLPQATPTVKGKFSMSLKRNEKSFSNLIAHFPILITNVFKQTLF